MVCGWSQPWAPTPGPCFPLPALGQFPQFYLCGPPGPAGGHLSLPRVIDPIVRVPGAGHSPSWLPNIHSPLSTQSRLLGRICSPHCSAYLAQSLERSGNRVKWPLPPLPSYIKMPLGTSPSNLPSSFPSQGLCTCCSLSSNTPSQGPLWMDLNFSSYFLCNPMCIAFMLLKASF